MSGDPLIEELRRRAPACGFCAATALVIAGHDLRSDGNRYFGKSVYMQTGDEPVVARDDLRRGRSVRVGDRERFPRCELRCRRDDGRVVVQVLGEDGSELSRPLFCPAGPGDDYDEARFVWLAPQEYLCSPWHDGDPQCQVITIEGLRAFARAWKPDAP